MSQNNFAEQLKALRKQCNLTQQLFADQLNVHLQTVSKWERGISEPDISLLGDIARIFDVSVGQLVEENGEEIVVGQFNAVALGTNIAKLRHAAAQDQKTLAKALCVSADTVSKWERAKNCPDIDSLVALAKHFSVPVSALYCGKAVPTQNAEVKRRLPHRVWIPILATVVMCVVLLGLVLGLTLDGPNPDNGENPTHVCQYGDWQVIQPPTCATVGRKVRICTLCNTPQEELIAATGHSYETAVSEACCSAQGYTLHTCTVCGDSYKDNYVDILPHQFVFQTENAATCTEQGAKIYVCTVCNATNSTPTNALGHSYEQSQQEPTCTAQGYTLHTCTVCGSSYKDNYVDVLPHQFVLQTETPATCTEQGAKVFVCTVCAATQSTSTNALGHNYTQSQQESTCTAQGYTLHTCTVCGSSYKDNYVDVLPHQFVLQTETPATCTEQGAKVFVCTVCAATQSTPTNALGHNYEQSQQESTCTAQGYTLHTCTVCGHFYQDNYLPLAEHTAEALPALSPTCADSGLSEGQRCSVCKKILVQQEIVSPLGHLFDLGTCTRCSFEIVPTDEALFSFSLKEDGTYAIVSSANLPEEVVIPWSHSGCPVTEIWSGAISQNAQIKSIFIPQSIRKIGNGAMHCNTGLQSVYYLGSVSQWLEVDIADYNFMHAHALYFNGNLLTDLVIPEGLTVAKRNHFHYCSSLKTIVFTEDVVEIEYYAFEYCTNAQSVFIPYTVLIMGTHAFACTDATIYCEAISCPSNWEAGWDYFSPNVIWGASAWD